MSKKILIIGSAGYIGSQLYDFLINKGHQVVGVDSNFISNPNHLNYVDYEQDYSTLSSSFIQSSDAVILLAGYNSPNACKGLTTSVISNNVTNFSNLLSKLGNTKLIYASSVCVFGNRSGYIGNDDLYGDTVFDMYGLSKVMIDKLVEIAKPKHYYGMRFGTVVGGSSSMRWNLMLNKMVYDACESGTITIKNGKSLKPILFMGDLINTITDIVEEDSNNSGFYNLVSQTSSVKTYAHLTKRYLKNKGVDVNIVDLGDDEKYYSYYFSMDKIEELYTRYSTNYNDILDNIYENYKNRTQNCMNRILEKNESYGEFDV